MAIIIDIEPQDVIIAEPRGDDETPGVIICNKKVKLHYLVMILLLVASLIVIVALNFLLCRYEIVVDAESTKCKYNAERSTLNSTSFIDGDNNASLKRNHSLSNNYMPRLNDYTNANLIFNKTENLCKTKKFMTENLCKAYNVILFSVLCAALFFSICIGLGVHLYNEISRRFYGMDIPVIYNAVSNQIIIPL